MATVGTTDWTRMPGDTETPGENGSLEVVRMYNGLITGWAAFRASNPPGTNDPVYGSALKSTGFPAIVSENRLTMTASITFSGGDFEEGQETTEPTTSYRMVSKVIHVKHPENEVEVELTYLAWQTTLTYSQKSEPNDDGQFSSKVKETNVTRTSPPILQKELENEIPPLTDAQIVTATDHDTWLEDLQKTRRGNSGHWDATEVWIRGLKLA